MKLLKLHFISLPIFLLLITAGCRKFVEISPPKDQMANQAVYENDGNAIAAMRGIYAQMMINQSFANGGIFSTTLLAGRSADEFTNYSVSEFSQQFSDNSLTPNNIEMRSGLWQSTYKYIYFANALIENLQRSQGISDAMKQQLGGEARFIRAFCHFYLTNLFGNVPIILTTDYRVNATVPASTQEAVYQQIIKDLREAKSLLNENYPSTERIRVNKVAASALLARVYLFIKDWSSAETESTEVIAKSASYILLDDLNQVFLKNSKECILQFAPTTPTINTNEGNIFILNAVPGALSQVVLNERLVSAFEPGDQRLSKWVGVFTRGTNSWHYAYKYKIKTGGTPRAEYSMVLRLAEQYLIRAESRINQGNIVGGITDLNVLRKRARAIPTVSVPNPLPDLLASVLSKSDALLAVEKERRVELFSEWGHRWLDLKRTSRADAVLAPIKGANWQSTDVLYPIPVSEIINNPNLKQNPAYH